MIISFQIDNILPCMQWLFWVIYQNKKSHTCEEGGAHLRISVWHLLTKLKNNNLLKKLLQWANKKCKNFNIYNIVFFKKKMMKNTWRYHSFSTCVPKILMIWSSSWAIECDRLQLVIKGHFLLSPSLKTLKFRILIKWKNSWGYHFQYVQKTDYYEVQFLSYGVRVAEFFCHFWPFFALLPS